MLSQIFSEKWYQDTFLFQSIWYIILHLRYQILPISVHKFILFHFCSSPLIAKAYDAGLIKVTDIQDGIVGDLSTFRVDASKAGKRFLLFFAAPSAESAVK